MADKQRPYLASLEAEQSVLGALLIDRMAIYQVRAVLDVLDFSRDGHRKLYQGILDVIGAGKELDFVTLCDTLEQSGTLDKVGNAQTWGPAYLTTLITTTPTSLHVMTYADTVRDYALRRQLQHVGAQIVRAAYDESADTALNKSLAWLGAIDTQGATRMRSSKELATAFYDRAEKWLDNPSETWGLPTGMRDLDRLTGGLERGEYVIIAARPSMGKSSLALQIARHVAEQGHGVAFFSLEVGPTQLMMRLACSQAEIDSQQLRKGQLTTSEQTKLVEQMALISVLPIWWCFRPGITMQEVTNEVAKLQLRGDVPLVVIDYLQLMQSAGENQNVRVSRISQGIKQLVVSMDCCVLALSQLSRGIEQRADRTPRLSDLRDSGSLEQDGDKILFIDRVLGTDGAADIVLAKNRNGPSGVGIQTLVFREKYTVFVDMAR